jgi:hypothetical protein
MRQTISFEELDKLIDSQEDKGMKKALLIVKSTTRPLRGNKEELTIEQLEKVVTSQIEAQEASANKFLDDAELEDIYLELAGIAENLGQVIQLVIADE